MKLIVTPDKSRVINFERIKTLYVCKSAESQYKLFAESIEVSKHSQLGNGKKQLQEIIAVMSADGPVVYQAEDTE